VPIVPTAADMAIFRFFKMVVVCHLELVLRVWTTHEEYLVVFITLQNLVRIGAVVLIIAYASFNILRVRLENACSRPQNRFLGLDPLNGQQCQRDPKRHTLLSVRVV